MNHMDKNIEDEIDCEIPSRFTGINTYFTLAWNDGMEKNMKALYEPWSKLLVVVPYKTLYISHL